MEKYSLSDNVAFYLLSSLHRDIGDGWTIKSNSLFFKEKAVISLNKSYYPIHIGYIKNLTGVNQERLFCLVECLSKDFSLKNEILYINGNPAKTGDYFHIEF